VGRAAVVRVRIVSEHADTISEALDGISSLVGPAYFALAALEAELAEARRRATEVESWIRSVDELNEAVEQRAEAAEAENARLTQERDEARRALVELSTYPEVWVARKHNGARIDWVSVVTRMQSIARDALVSGSEGDTA
jgi:chromosome segregation ATPase